MYVIKKLNLPKKQKQSKKNMKDYISNSTVCNIF